MSFIASWLKRLRKLLPINDSSEAFCGETVKWAVYWILAVFTLSLFLEYWFKFLGQIWGVNYQGVPSEVRNLWLYSVMLYGPMLYLQKELGNLKDLNQNGELWGLLVFANPILMWMFNMARDVFFRQPHLKYPDGVIRQSLEALALLSISRLLKYRLQRKSGRNSCSDKNSVRTAKPASKNAVEDSIL